MVVVTVTTTGDMHYYGPPQTRFPSREAWRNCEQNWQTPQGPSPFPKLRIDDGEEYPVHTRIVEVIDEGRRVL